MRQKGLMFIPTQSVVSALVASRLAFASEDAALEAEAVLEALLAPPELCDVLVLPEVVPAVL